MTEDQKFTTTFDRSYAIARDALRDVEGVTVKHIDDIRTGGVGGGIESLLGSFPPAYSLDVIALEEGINVIRNSRFGFSVGSGPNVIPFPSDPNVADAAERLAEVLVPLVREELRLAAEDRASVTDGGPIESRDAVRRIGGSR